MSTLAERFQFTGMNADHRDPVGPGEGRPKLIPPPAT